MPSTKPRVPASAVLLAIVLVIFVGSLLYWIGEGRPGTPGDFRREVAESGLTVAWSNNGSRAGSGTVETTCGQIGVEISRTDEGIWLRWEENGEILAPSSIGMLIACESP